jgi:pimeloyl-ACP methyl ester carboxylesterase
MECQARRGLDGRQIPAVRLVPPNPKSAHTKRQPRLRTFAKVPREAPTVMPGLVSRQRPCCSRRSFVRWHRHHGSRHRQACGSTVNICAFAPEDGDTTLGDQGKYPATPIFQHIEVVEGRIWLRPSGVPEFAGDLPEAEQQLVWATQMAPLADLFGQPVPGAAWKLKPTSYIVGSNDRTIKPELERFLAKRMNANVTEVASSHVPMLSQPRRVYEVIRDAAVDIQR